MLQPRFLTASLLAAMCLALPIRAEPAPPQTDPQITILDYGIYCRPDVIRQDAAPDTKLGYINVFSEIPVIRHRQQVVPAALGVSFGLILRSEEDFPSTRMESWKPGQTEPEVWFSSLAAGDETSRGFTFEFEEELILGTWRLQSWDRDRLLYSIEFEVVPAKQLSGIVALCDMLS